MGDLILPAGTKLLWIEQVAKDRNASDFHVRVCVGIASHVDRYTGVARVSQAQLANTISATERGVRKALADLADDRLGHIARTSGGSKRGDIATYQPIVRRRNGGSAFQGPDCDGRRNGGSGNTEAQKGEQRSTEGGTVVPPLPYKNPSKNPGACARARETSQLAQDQPLQSGLSDEGTSKGWMVEPYSPEFEAWIEHYTDRGFTKSKQQMLSCAHSGISVRVPSQWPPTEQRSLNGGLR
jgi:hypothetical protein